VVYGQNSQLWAKDHQTLAECHAVEKLFLYLPVVYFSLKTFTLKSQCN